MITQDGWIECDTSYGSLDRSTGYRRKYVNGIRNYAHRIRYIETYGEIPEGFQIDHLCGNRECSKPEHLEAVPQFVNHFRSSDVRMVAHRAGLCVRGHLVSESVRRLGTGAIVYCKACRREKRRATA